MKKKNYLVLKINLELELELELESIIGVLLGNSVLKIFP